MAGTAVLERELKKQDENRTYEEKAKESKAPSAYDVLRTRPAARTASAMPETYAGNGVSAANPTLERVNSYYQAPAAPARKKALFENVAYVNGELVERNPETEELTRVFDNATYAQPKVREEVKAPVADEPKDARASAVAEPETEDTEEDALPTRRTMESVIRSASVQEITVTDTRTGFKAAITSLSTKMKIVLLTVATAILLAIVLICVNTSIIRSLDSDLSDLRGRATEQQTTYENLQKESDLYTDPDSEIVAEWAQNNGMTK